MIPGTDSGRPTHPLETDVRRAGTQRVPVPRLARRLAQNFTLAAALAVALSLGYTASPADAQEPLARTSQVTDAKEQLAFGVKMARRGLWSEALFRFKQARRLDPSNPRVLNNMAVAYEALGHFDKALETYQEAVRLQSSDRDLRKNYSRFVEFYRAFRPDDQKDASLEEAETATAANDNATGTAASSAASTAAGTAANDNASNAGDADGEPTADDSSGSDAGPATGPTP